jgi:hypothetical protein
MNLLARRLLVLVFALLLLASCGSESEPRAKATATPTPTVGASQRGDIDVLDAVLVMNDDGSATLSAQIVNHTDEPREIGNVTLSDLDVVGEPIRRWGIATHSMIKPGATATIGNIDDLVRIRVARDVAPGKDVGLDVRLDPADMTTGYVMVTLKVPVVTRSAMYDGVAGNQPNTAIKVEDARIAVLPGQRKAYVNGAVISTITDWAYELPTAVNSDGKPVAYQHQTATGGPYGMEAKSDKKVEIGMGPPYKEFTGGDADYFDATDVTVGETITVTIPFESGDVVVPFKVVAG